MGKRLPPEEPTDTFRTPAEYSRKYQNICRNIPLLQSIEGPSEWHLQPASTGPFKMRGGSFYCPLLMRSMVVMGAILKVHAASGRSLHSG